MAKNEEKSLSQSEDKKASKIICVKNNYFGEALKELRLEKGFSQKDLADAVEITQAQWSSYELGKSRPTLDMIIAIAQVVKISPFVLINKSLDKSKYFGTNKELSFNDFDQIENSIENFRAKKFENQLELSC